MNNSYNLLFTDKNREVKECHDFPAIFEFQKFSEFCGEGDSFLYIKNILISQNLTQKDLSHRAEINDDLKKNPVLMGKLEDVLRRLNYINENIPVILDCEKTTNEILDDFKAVTMSLMEHLRFIRQLKSLFEGININSKGLYDLKNFIETFSGSSLFAELGRVAAGYPLLSTANAKYELEITLGKAFEISECEVVFAGVDTDNRRGVFRKLLESLSGDDFDIVLENITKEANSEFIGNAFLKLQERFITLSTLIRGCFKNLPVELAFYRFSQNLEAALRDGGYPVCYAEISGDNVFYAESFCDYTLALQNKNVIFNSFTKNDSRLFIITGREDCGKSVYLRALACLQLFGSVGLPLPAVMVKIGLLNKIFFYSSKSSISEEMESLAAIMEKADSDSLIFLDDPLLSAGIYEASKLLYNILQAFLHLNATCFCVTSLYPLTVRLSVFGVKTRSLVSHDGSLRFKVTEDTPILPLRSADTTMLYGMTGESLYQKVKSRL